MLLKWSVPPRVRASLVYQNSHPFLRRSSSSSSSRAVSSYCRQYFRHLKSAADYTIRYLRNQVLAHEVTCFCVLKCAFPASDFGAVYKCHDFLTYLLYHLNEETFYLLVFDGVQSTVSWYRTVGHARRRCADGTSTRRRASARRSSGEVVTETTTAFALVDSANGAVKVCNRSFVLYGRPM